MLKPASDTAKGFLADTQVRSNLAKRDTFYYMWGLLN